MNSDSGDVKARILIVDDHRISRQFLAAALRQNPVLVKQAATASRALSIGLDWLPDVVLMDVRLGTDSGFEVARQLSERWPRGLSKPAIFMLTAGAPRSGSLQGMRSRDFPVLRKPVNVQRLLSSILPQDATPPAGSVDRARPRLRTLFRRELAAQLPAIENALCGRDLQRARGILHKLIASSGLSGEQRLERRLRSLHGACARKKTAAGLACEYYLLLACAREFIEPCRP